MKDYYKQAQKVLEVIFTRFTTLKRQKLGGHIISRITRSGVFEIL